MSKQKSPHEIPKRVPLPNEKIPVFAFVFLGLALVSLILVLIARQNTAFADFFNDNISSVFRAVLAWITGPLPFSLAELLILSSPLIVTLIIWWAIRRKSTTWRAVVSYIVTLLASASVLFSLFVFTFGMGYHTTTLDKRIGLDKQPVSAEELYDTAMILVEKTNALVPTIRYELNGSSSMPYSLSEMGDKLMLAYSSFSNKHPFVQRLDSNIKPVLFSVAMSYTQITGVYTFFTGESNLNIDFPDYSLPFTAAHEFAHQRGIAREDEANFVAFLICIESEDPYIRYCGYLNLYEYVSSKLYSADQTQDKSLYYGAREALDSSALGEIRAAALFNEKYSNSFMGSVGDSVNNAYLTLSGVQEGSKSYGLVVDLAVAYYKDR